MDIDNLSNEISRLQIDNVKLLARIANAFYASGEQGVLLWLNQRTTDTYAIDVIDHFGLTPGRVANIIKKLEQRRYIERVQDTEDQRKARILVTDSGVSYATDIYSQMNNSHAYLIEMLGENDALEWIRLLKRIISIIDNNNFNFQK